LISVAGRDRNESKSIAAAMTIEQVTALTELERDAPGEIANIAMARVATSMRQMVGHQVLLSVPAVELLSRRLPLRSSGHPTTESWLRSVRISSAHSPDVRC
jgi:CheY-specific phosphatase CheX